MSSGRTHLAQFKLWVVDFESSYHHNVDLSGRIHQDTERSFMKAHHEKISHKVGPWPCRSSPCVGEHLDKAHTSFSYMSC